MVGAVRPARGRAGSRRDPRGTRPYLAHGHPAGDRRLGRRGRADRSVAHAPGRPARRARDPRRPHPDAHRRRSGRRGVPRAATSGRRPGGGVRGRELSPRPPRRGAGERARGDAAVAPHPGRGSARRLAPVGAPHRPARGTAVRERGRVRVPVRRDHDAPRWRRPGRFPPDGDPAARRRGPSHGRRRAVLLPRSPRAGSARRDRHAGLPGRSAARALAAPGAAPRALRRRRLTRAADAAAADPDLRPAPAHRPGPFGRGGEELPVRHRARGAAAHGAGRARPGVCEPPRARTGRRG